MLIIIKMIGDLFQLNGQYPIDDECPEILDDCEIEALTYQVSKSLYELAKENQPFQFLNWIFFSHQTLAIIFSQ